jgi:hypothetical protein
MANAEKKDDEAMALRGVAPAMTAWLYYLGLAIDTILLLIACGNALVLMYGTSIDGGLPDEPAAGLTVIGRIALWAIPLVLLGLMASAHRLKARGALIAANVLLWLPALPFGLAASFWVVLIVAFAIGGR